MRKHINISRTILNFLMLKKQNIVTLEEIDLLTKVKFHKLE